MSRVLSASRFKKASTEDPQPNVHLRADENTPYRYVAQTIVDASKAGLSKVGFITQPEDENK